MDCVLSGTWKYFSTFLLSTIAVKLVLAVIQDEFLRLISIQLKSTSNQCAHLFLLFSVFQVHHRFIAFSELPI